MPKKNELPFSLCKIENKLARICGAHGVSVCVCDDVHVVISPVPSLPHSFVWQTLYFTMSILFAAAAAVRNGLSSFEFIFIVFFRVFATRVRRVRNRNENEPVFRSFFWAFWCSKSAWAHLWLLCYRAIVVRVINSHDPVQKQDDADRRRCCGFCCCCCSLSWTIFAAPNSNVKNVAQGQSFHMISSPFAFLFSNRWHRSNWCE